MEKKKIHLIMPMGGGGTRFGNKGFQLPKPLIPLHGHPFFYWAVESITRFVDVADITFIILKDHVMRFSIDTKITKYYPDAKLVVIDHVLNGAVLTCMEGVKTIEDELPLLFNDCDHMFRCQSFNCFCNEGDFFAPDGALLTFHSDEDKYSYVQLDQNGKVIRTVEKQVISNQAICGAYYFKNKELFLMAAQQYLEKCAYREYFVSGVYNILGDMGKDLVSYQVDIHIPFGTPDEYDAAEKMERFGEILG